MNQTTKQIMAVLVLVAAFTTSLWALDPRPCPAGYYNAALNKYGQNLISALYGIVGSHTNIGYDGLLEAYADTDTENGYLIDMYSTYDKYTWDTKRCGNYDAIGDCWNREHSFPKSWWGGGTDQRYSDIFHLYPTDGYVNNQRNNYPFGECANGTRLQVTIGGKTYVGKGKLGYSTFDGYSDKVFEPDDEYKGDFARSYFYVATAYYNSTGWTGDMLKGSSNHFPFFTDWAINLLLKWHRQDPVSQKEIKRNNYAHSWQGNRNPYIDHPELAEHIWGNKSTVAWTGSESTDPALISPSAGTTIDMGIVHTGTPATQTLFVRGVNLTKSVSVSVTGTGFSVSPSTISASNANNGTNVTVTYQSATAANATGTVTVSSTEFASVSVPLSAQAVEGIVAQNATNVTETSFVARWQNSDQSTGNYLLYVAKADGTPVSGYNPKSVRASNQAQTVSGLEPSTTYDYYLKSATNASFVSNHITVTTADLLPVLDILGNFYIMAKLENPSPIVEGQIYTENVTEDLVMEVDGNFEISLDKDIWGQQLDIDKDGEVFYLRVTDTGTAGDYTGTLSVSNSRVDADITVSATVSESGDAPVTFFEDFEKLAGTTPSYGTAQEVTCTAGKWIIKAYYGGDGGDRAHGEKCVRMRNSNAGFIEMAEDKAGGAGEISFYAAPFSNDAAATLKVSYSVDQGSTWTELTGVTAANVARRAPQGPRGVSVVQANELKRYAVQANIEGNVRIKIEQTGGNRVDVDDVAITDYSKPIPTSITDIDAAQRGWDAHPVKGGIEVEAKGKVAIYNMDARQVAGQKVAGKAVIDLAPGIYVVVVNNQSKKVIVKK